MSKDTFYRKGTNVAYVGTLGADKESVAKLDGIRLAIMSINGIFAENGRDVRLRTQVRPKRKGFANKDVTMAEADSFDVYVQERV